MDPTLLGQRRSPFHIMVTSYHIMMRDVYLQQVPWRVFLLQALGDMTAGMLPTRMLRYWNRIRLIPAEQRIMVFPPGDGTGNEPWAVRTKRCVPPCL